MLNYYSWLTDFLLKFNILLRVYHILFLQFSSYISFLFFITFNSVNIIWFFFFYASVCQLVNIYLNRHLIYYFVWLRLHNGSGDKSAVNIKYVNYLYTHVCVCVYVFFFQGKKKNFIPASEVERGSVGLSPRTNTHQKTIPGITLYTPWNRRQALLHGA